MIKKTSFFCKYQREIFFILFCFFFYFAWSQLIPYNNAPDEDMRYDIAYFIYSKGYLPVGNEPEIVNPLWGQSYAYQPILAYQIAAVFMKAAAFFKMADDKLYLAARFANTIIATGTVAMVLAIGRKCFKGKGAYLFGAMICLLPQFVFISSYVNNDTLALFSTALIFYAWVLGIKGSWDFKTCTLLGFGLSLCFLSYYNAYGFILCSVIIYVGDYLINRKEWPLKKFLGYGILIVAICMLLAGWWFVRSALLHNGDILGMRSSAELAEQLAQSAYKPSLHVTPANSGYSLLQMLFGYYTDPFQNSPPWIFVTYISFLGNFGNMSISMEKLLYVILTLIYGVGGGGCLLWWCKSERKEEGKRGHLFTGTLLLAVMAPIMLSIYYSYTSDYQPQGRYVMTALIPLMYFLTNGLIWIEKKLQDRGIKISLSLIIIASEIIVVFYTFGITLNAAV